MKTRALILIFVLTALTAWPASYYTQRLDDAQAVYLTPDQFNVKGDGVADDSAAIQSAINKAQETTGNGVVFVPEGIYRLTTTIYVWPGIRLIGYGTKRPVFVLGENTPGYTDRAAERYMIFFAGGRPGFGRGGQRGNPNAPPSDANPGTFYSAMSNIDIEIRAGNHGATAMRGRYAQHCFLAHMEIRIGPGIAGIHDTGNVVEDVRFTGGEYGVWTIKPSPGWQFTMIDVEFQDQRAAAIREQEAGLTLIRPTFRNVPTAIEIEADHIDELWVKDARMENISGPAVVISRETSPRTMVNMEGVVCNKVPVFAQLRESGRKIAGPGAIYDVKTFSHGLHFDHLGATPAINFVFNADTLTAMPAPVKSDIPDLPDRATWVNAKTLGAKGDGKTDDTAALKAAVAQHRAIYLPTGKYIISDTLALRPDTVLIGMHPNTTQLVLLDSTPAFQGVGNAKPMIEAPKGGTNIIIGIGVYPNGINPRALAIKWMAGADSMLNDVRFLGGHGTAKLDGSRENPYNNNHTADPDLRRRWDGQYPSLWVTDGGGGTFLDLWTPDMFSQAGMLVTNTTTEGRVYQMSSEHHVRYEMQMRNAANWKIYALQTEAERGESGFALQLEIDNCRNITVANLHVYRVISSFQPFPWAVKVSNSDNIRFRNIHVWSNSKVSYDSSIYDETRNVEVREREFAWLDITASPLKPIIRKPSTLINAGAKMQKLAGGFYNASGGAVSPTGDFYFVDSKWQRIHKWDVVKKQLSVVHDAPLDPVNLAFDKAGNLIVLSYSGNGTVYTFKPDQTYAEIALLPAVAATSRPGLTPILPVSDFRLATPPQPRTHQFVSPDNTTFIAADSLFMEGTLSWGIKSSPLLRGFGLAPAVSGKPFYMTDEVEIRTYVMDVASDGSISNMRHFAEQGGEGVAVDDQGNVYIAAGHIYVYTPQGKLIETIETPERPTQLVFGGKDKRTLFVLSRTSLYSVEMRNRGR